MNDKMIKAHFVRDKGSLSFADKNLSRAKRTFISTLIFKKYII